MILTEKKPIEEILDSVKEDKNIFLLSCNGCPEAAETGGKAQLEDLKKELEAKGKNVTSSTIIDFLCNKMLVTTRLMRHKKSLKDSDSVVIISCGIGVQAASNILEKTVHPALNTISMGGFQGLWPSDERCEQCGDCVLDLTCGVCPITFCSKSLLNGSCGGTKDGKCEVDKDTDCGWHLIYKRLKNVGKLDNLKKMRSPRNYNNMIPPINLRKKVFYDIER